MNLAAEERLEAAYNRAVVQGVTANSDNKQARTIDVCWTTKVPMRVSLASDEAVETAPRLWAFLGRTRCLTSDLILSGSNVAPGDRYGFRT